MSLQEQPLTAIHTASTAEESGAVQQLPPLKNHATTQAVVDFIRQQVQPLMQWCRDDRRELEDEWHAINRMIFMQHDDGQKYMGRSDAYIPGYLRAQETLTSALSRGLFPTDDFIEVTPQEEVDRNVGVPLKRYMQWEFMENAQIRRFIKPALAQLTGFGNMCMKYWYKKPSKGAFKTGRRNLLKSLKQTTLGFGDSNQNYCEGMRVSSRSMFNVFVYPVTAESQDDLTMVFEDVDVSPDFMRERAHFKEWENVEQAMQQSSASTNTSTQQSLHDARLGTDPVQASDGSANKRIRLQDIYTYMVLPPSEYLPDEDPALPLPVHIVMCGDVVLLAKRNEFFHQQIPYRFGRRNTLPGMFYGYGAGRPARGLQYLANDFSNQANDVGAYCLNPIVILDETYLPGPLAPIRPGGAWSTTDVTKAVRFERPPFELINPALQMKQDALSMLQDMSGAPAILQGLNAGKGAKTATSSQILQANATGPLQDTVEDIEYDVLIPMMLGAWKNAMQWRDAAVILRVGGKALQVTLQDLAINAEMRWSASSQIVNKQQRAQMAMQFLQTLVPLAPLMQAQGQMVNPIPFMRRIASDFGFKNFDETVVPVPVQPMQAPGQEGSPQEEAPEGEPSQPGEQPGEDIRSAVGQAGGGSPLPIQPGEGSEFMNVRDEADRLAAQYGQLGQLGPQQ